MNHPLFPVSVMMQRVPLVNRWVSEKWVLAEVACDEPSGEIVCVPQVEGCWLWRGFMLDLHPSEGEGYYLNMSTDDPRVFVMWRLEEWNGAETARPWVTTASYSEAARMLDAGEQVDSVSMPAEIVAW